MLNRLLQLVSEVRIRGKTLFEECSDLALEVGLTTESNLGTFICSDQGKCSFSFFIASEA